MMPRAGNAVFYCHEKKVAMFFEFFSECVYIMHIEQLKFKRYGNNY